MLQVDMLQQRSIRPSVLHTERMLQVDILQHVTSYFEALTDDVPDAETRSVAHSQRAT